jgi:hypothetical protein
MAFTEEGFTLITRDDQYFPLLSLFVLHPIFVTCSTILFVNLRTRSTNIANNNDNKNESIAIVCALLSFSITIARGLCATFLISNVILPIDFSSYDYHYTDIPTALYAYSYAFAKVFFYTAFSALIISKLDNDNSNTRNWLKLVTILACISILVLMSIFFYFDMTEHHIEDIGKFEGRDICLVINPFHKKIAGKNLLISLL